MNELVELIGKPQRIRLYNGPELVSQSWLDGWQTTDRIDVYLVRQTDTERLYTVSAPDYSLMGSLIHVCF